MALSVKPFDRYTQVEDEFPVSEVGFDTIRLSEWEPASGAKTQLELDYCHGIITFQQSWRKEILLGLSFVFRAFVVPGLISHQPSQCIAYSSQDFHLALGMVALWQNSFGFTQIKNIVSVIASAVDASINFPNPE